MTLTKFLLAPACSVTGCERGGKLTRKMCQTHYKYWLAHTPPEQRGKPPRFARNFWDYVDKSGECWLWIGAANPQGYGIWSDVRNTGERGLAHRISLIRETGAPLPGLLACHRCNIPACVNPAHLYWGTAEDNARDVAQAGGPYNKGVERTHCMRGHELAGDNLKITGRDKRRRCRTCENRRAREKMRHLRRQEKRDGGAN